MTGGMTNSQWMRRFAQFATALATKEKSWEAENLTKIACRFAVAEAACQKAESDLTDARRDRIADAEMYTALGAWAYWSLAKLSAEMSPGATCRRCTPPCTKSKQLCNRCLRTLAHDFVHWNGDFYECEDCLHEEAEEAKNPGHVTPLIDPLIEHFVTTGKENGAAEPLS